MLVLTRAVKQSIVIGTDVVVTILEIRGDQVRVGISAPRTVTVHREEVFAELVAANKAAASPDAGALDQLGSLRPPRRTDAARRCARKTNGKRYASATPCR